VDVVYETPGPEHAHSLVLAVAIAFDGYRAFAGPGWEPPDELTPENVERVAREIGEGFALMAVYEGDPVGHVLCVPRDEGYVHLRHLFVLEPWWGTDVARTLHGRAVEWIAGRPARLYTPARHQRARRFYAREGWTFFEERPEPKLGLDLAEYRRPR
jgi:GNAT superfamily N-acetyltransferase